MTMAYTERTRIQLAALSGNECAFQDCTAPIYDTDHNVMVGEVCHIRGKRPGSARYDLNQTDDERDAYENLILMCSPHHKIIDDEPERYTVEVLLEFKRRHESGNHRGVIERDALGRLVEALRQVLPTSAAGERPRLVLEGQQRRYGREVVLSLRNEGRGTAQTPHLWIRRFSDSYRISPYGVDGNNTPGSLGPPQGAGSDRSPYFGGSTTLAILPNTRVDVCVLLFTPSHDDSEPGGTVRIEYEVAAEGQERTEGIAEVRVGR